MLTEEERKRQKKYYAENREAKKAHQRRYYAENREVMLSRQRERDASPERKAYMKAYHAKWNTSPEGKASRAKYSERPEVKTRQAAYAAERFYGRATYFLMNLLWRFQDGKDYITGEPLTEGFCLDHDHSSDLVRGLVNERTNVVLAQKCGDALPGCRARLMKLKNKNGKLATFCRQAIEALSNTPSMRMGLEYRVVGAAASLPESRTNRDYIERTNMLAIDAYMSDTIDRKKVAA